MKKKRIQFPKREKKSFKIVKKNLNTSKNKIRNKYFYLIKAILFLMITEFEICFLQYPQR